MGLNWFMAWSQLDIFAWGLYYDLIIIIEKAGWETVLKKMWAPFRHVYVILIFMTGCFFFRADDFAYLLKYISTMFGLAGTRVHEPLTMFYLHNYGLVLLNAIIVSMPIVPWIQAKLSVAQSMAGQGVKQFILSVIYLALFVLCIIHLTNSTFNPFIYFRF